MIVRKALMLLFSLMCAATDCCTIDPKLTSLRGGGGRQAWIQDFCRTPGNEFFAEVPLSFIRESMNSIDIGRGVDIPYRQEALGVILGERFLVSPQGLKVVLEKFSKADFGRCPRVYCQGQAVLPVGESDRPKQSSVKVFCPRCGDLYYPSGYVRACDGAFWGTTLPHLLLLGWPELKTTPNTSHYVPRVFGFKVHAEELSASDQDGHQERLS
ncbi:unnamed protein product [Ectocarpus sp. CCAP 1310/34]|nr:unnamed protein product [Ectocarpus sp. CCAP 1310/34]